MPSRAIPGYFLQSGKTDCSKPNVVSIGSSTDISKVESSRSLKPCVANSARRSQLRSDSWSSRYDPFRLLVEHEALTKPNSPALLKGSRCSFVTVDDPDEWIAPDASDLQSVNQRTRSLLGRVGVAQSWNHIEVQLMPVHFRLFANAEPTVDASKQRRCSGTTTSISHNFDCRRTKTSRLCTHSEQRGLLLSA